MSDQTSFQDFLNAKYNEVRSRNGSYSIRAFAQQLGIQPSAANEIMKGQRRISKKLAEKITDKLKLDPQERTVILSDFDTTETKKSPVNEANKKALKLNQDQFELISNWIHFAILSVVKLSDFKSDVDWIAQRLGVESVDVRKALLKLQHLNLIHISDKGVMTRTPEPVRTSDDIRSLALQEMHLNDMQMAARKIKDVPVHLRDFTNFTFPANPETLPRAKEILRKTQDDLEELMQGEATEVYRLCQYLFPLSNKQDPQ